MLKKIYNLFIKLINKEKKEINEVKEKGCIEVTRDKKGKIIAFCVTVDSHSHDFIPEK